MSLELKKRPSKKAIILTSVAALLVIAGISSSAQNNSQQEAPQVKTTAQTEQVESAQTAKAPKIETKTATETEVIPYGKKTQNDSTLESGKTVLAKTGVNGEKTITYQVTLTDGKETSRTKSGEQITVQPVDEVTKIGTKVTAAPAPAQNCDPNYTGACVPIASDVDCYGGSGNGPAYVRGPVTVIGRDIYGLDRDGNGVGCE
jgi:hypothetical protein